MVNLLWYFPSQLTTGSDSLKPSMNSLCSALLWTTRSRQDYLVHYLEDHPTTLQINQWSSWRLSLQIVKNRRKQRKTNTGQQSKDVTSNLNIMIQLINKRKACIFNNENKNKKKLSILKDECESRSNVAAQFKQQNLDVKLLLYCSVTSESRIICFKLEKKVLLQSCCSKLTYNFYH